MPLRILAAYIWISRRRDPAELAGLGISPDLLASPEDVAPLDDDSVYRSEFWDAHASRIYEVAHALVESHQGDAEALVSPALGKLVDAGLLTMTGWSAKSHGPWSLVWTDDDEFLGEIIDDLVDGMGSWSDAVLIEPGTQFLAPEVLRQRAPTHPSTEDLAAAFIARLPGLSDLTIDELMEIRADLEDYLAGFRAEVIAIRDDLVAGSDTPKDVIDRAWHTRVNPILKELDAKTKRGSYPRQLLGVFADDLGAKAATGASVLLAAGSTVAGISALLPAAAAASVPFMRAWNQRLKARDDVRDHRLFFLYEASRRATRASQHR